jgi:hydroxyacylglutathione hydrolase
MPVLRPEYAPLFKESIFYGKTGFHFAGKCSHPGDIMAAEIRLFPCLTDNFGYLIHDPATKATASIDAPEAAPIIKALEREGWTLTDILVTHHHGDHVGGVAELKQKYNCRVVAPHDKSTKIANADARVKEGDAVKVGGLTARVLETPGHTLDHVSYVFDSEKALFAADTLFSIGCGRVFEGTYPQMWDSLLKLRALPDDFKLYCGHEYTAANVKFALTVEPDNAALRARAEQVTRLRADNKPTVPTLLGEEKKANVFLRADEPSVAAGVRLKGRGAAEVFGELRERKNKS